MRMLNLLWLSKSEGSCTADIYFNNDKQVSHALIGCNAGSKSTFHSRLTDHSIESINTTNYDVHIQRNELKFRFQRFPRTFHKCSV